jgi:hypothetical protein
MTTPHDDDTLRDAHLLAALRHAPDREATPPPEVTARILAAARAAVRDAQPSWAQRLAAWWGAPRVGVGAAFGTLLAAVLVGVLLSTREPLPLPSKPSAPPPTAAAPGRDSTAAPSEPPAAAAEAMRDAAPPARAGERKRSVEQQAAKVQGGGQSPEVQAAPPAAAAPAPAPPKAKAEADAASTQPSAGAMPSRQRPAELGRLSDRREDANAAPTPSADARLSSQAARAASDPLSPLDALVLGAAPDAARVAWRTARSLGHGPAQQAWWRELRAATQGRWQRADAAPQAFAPWLALSVDGGDRARWWLQGDQLLLLDAQGATWRAPLSAAQARAWSEAVAGW